MTKTSDEKKEHEYKVMKIANELAAEYGAWYGWTSGIGRYVALGEYILDPLCIRHRASSRAPMLSARADERRLGVAREGKAQEP